MERLFELMKTATPKKKKWIEKKKKKEKEERKAGEEELRRERENQMGWRRRCSDVAVRVVVRK